MRPRRVGANLARGASGAAVALFARVRAAPKVELHRHLLGSIRPATLRALGQKYGVSADRRAPALARVMEVAGAAAQRASVVRPLRVADYFAPWKLFRSVVRTPDDVRRIATEAAEDAREDGVRYVEFRTTLPSMPVTDGDAPQTRIPTGEYLAAIRDGFAAVPGVACRLIASVPRHVLGPAAGRVMADYRRKFLAAVERFRGAPIVGVDLTGVERGWPAAMFRELFAATRAAGFPATIHAGESEGPGEIRDAVELLGAARVGHGTSAPDDPALVRELIDRGVTLEVCPTSSRLLGRSPLRARHPVIECRPPLLYAIGTDNPTLNRVTLTDELIAAARIAGADPVEFAAKQFRVASRAAFDRGAFAATALPSGTG